MMLTTQHFDEAETFTIYKNFKYIILVKKANVLYESYIIIHLKYSRKLS